VLNNKHIYLILEFLRQQVAPVHIEVIGHQRVGNIAGMDDYVENKLYSIIIDIKTLLSSIFSLSNARNLISSVGSSPYSCNYFNLFEASTLLENLATNLTCLLYIIYNHKNLTISVARIDVMMSLLI
jgi:hypothetical protein